MGRIGRRVPPADGGAARPLRDVLLLGAAAAVYFAGRVLVEGPADRAQRNAERLLDVERTLGIDVEHTLQAWAEHEPIRTIGNLSYVWLHWPLLIVCFVVLLTRDHTTFRRCRDTIVVSGAIGLVLFALVPMSPPRFLPDLAGTVSDAARRHYLGYPLDWLNQYAAFPSYHAAWTFVACLAVRSTVRQPLVRSLLLVPGPLVAVAAVTTGNHYVIDSVVGVVIVVAAWVLLGRRGAGDAVPGPAAPMRTAESGPSVGSPHAMNGSTAPIGPAHP